MPGALRFASVDLCVYHLRGSAPPDLGSHEEDTDAMRVRSRWLLPALAGVVVAGSASAGLLDAPPPSLGAGVPATIVYRMGAVHYEPGGWVDTTVTCTNVGSAPATIGLEIFDDADQKAGQLALATVAPGASVTFGTSADAAPGAVAVAGLSAIDHGKARVSASTTQLTCTALNHMRGNDGVMKESPVELVKKVAF